MFIMMFKEYFGIAKSYMAERRNEMVITGVMAGLFAAIAVLSTGDIGQVVEAGRRR